MPDVTQLPAFDRVQTPAERDPKPRAVRPVVLVVLVLLGVAATVWFLQADEVGSDSFLVRLVERTATVRPDLATTVPSEAQGLVLDELGWSVPPPDLPGLALVGAAVTAVGDVKPGAALAAVPVEVPMFRFEGAGGERAHVYAYDYILLDRIGAAFDLPEATYAVLSEPTPVDSRVVEGSYVVTWRERAMIFSAVTPDEAVAERVLQSLGR